MRVLSLENVAVHYGKSQALHEVSLTVKQGEFVTILGANGAGKSTIMKCIMGLVKPSGGRVIYAGSDITAQPVWQRAALGIGYVPEGRRVFPDLTIEENLKMGGYSLSDPARLKDNIEKAYLLYPRLGERKNQAAKTMSGGEQQMLAIARALMSDPKLLLIDEISMGLMPILVNHSLQVVSQLNQAGITVLLVEQNANKALKYAGRGYVLKTGRITLADSSENLQNNEEVVKAYLGE
ncbi:MAG: ABC transporter ATP-binding protein [Negativicutes bacterium]|nr:ABC transporter ATP-binding protein [Negativicutes bacterium]